MILEISKEEVEREGDSYFYIALCEIKGFI